MIGKLILLIVVLLGGAYGVMMLFTTYSLLQIISWAFIIVATFLIFWLAAAYLSGAKTHG